MIPKIIHQTWKNEIIPDKWKDAVESVKENNKKYKYILWTDIMMDNFVKQEYPLFYKHYINYPYNIQRCDVFRYLVLYKYGGIYLDMDIICKKSFDDFLKYNIVFARSYNINSSFTNSFFMSIPKHPFIKYCIENLLDNYYNFYYFGKHLHIMYSTGPLFLTKMINNYNISKINNVYILSNEEFSGDCNVCNENYCKGGKYFIHINGNSWHSFDSTLYNFIFCNYHKLLILLLFIIILLKI